MTVLDASNHDSSTFDAACLKAAGVTKIIFGCWDLGITLDMVAKTRAVGIDATELYCFIYPRMPWEMREVQNAVQVQRQLGGIRIGWPDCESQFTEWPGDLDTEAAGTTVAQRLQILRNARTALRGAGMSTGIYTGDSYWKTMYGGTDEFIDDSLWLPNYGTNDPAHPLPKGAITGITLPNGRRWVAARHQYSSTIEVCGRNRDHNYDLQEDTSMTDDELLAIWSGKEEATLDRDTRLVNARYRRDEAAAGRAPSVAELAASAAVAAQNPPPAQSAGLANHDHVGGKVVLT